jgi:hypothetical protein
MKRRSCRPFGTECHWWTRGPWARAQWLHPVAALRLRVAALRLGTSLGSSLNELLFEIVFWVVMDLMEFQHAQNFFLKRFIPMALLLVQHVRPHFANLRLTNEKSTAFLQ